MEIVEALAHDLKSPLLIIKAYSEALYDDTNVDEEQRQYLAVIEENVEKSVSLVQQMQYTPNEGSIEIIVTSADSRIYYSVCYNGTGFSPKDIEKAFDRFYRADEARQTQGGHSGLGLYIVKQLIELLGGSIQIKNLETGGACVEFWHNR